MLSLSVIKGCFTDKSFKINKLVRVKAGFYGQNLFCEITIIRNNREPIEKCVARCAG